MCFPSSHGIICNAIEHKDGERPRDGARKGGDPALCPVHLFGGRGRGGVTSLHLRWSAQGGGGGPTIRSVHRCTRGGESVPLPFWPCCVALCPMLLCTRMGKLSLSPMVVRIGLDSLSLCPHPHVRRGGVLLPLPCASVNKVDGNSQPCDNMPCVGAHQGLDPIPSSCVGVHKVGAPVPPTFWCTQGGEFCPSAMLRSPRSPPEAPQMLADHNSVITP